MTARIPRPLAVVALVLTASAQLAAQASSDAPRPASHAVPDFDVPAAQLRVALDTTLAEHAFLLAEAMRARLGTGEGFDAVGEALEENSVQLIGLVESVYGEDAGRQFGDLWRAHVAYLVDYTRALAADDESAQALAERQLHTYVQDFSAFLAAANPNLPAAAVEELIGEHVQQLQIVVAFDAGDYERAYPAMRRTYTHMYTIGDALAQAIAVQFPERFPGRSLAFSPAGALRIALDRLLGEHTVLAVTAMRAAVTDAADLEAATAALESNTEDLGAAIGDVYGDAAGQAFVDVWRTHTDAYLEYVNSTIADDADGQAQALEQLATYRTEFSAFLTQANPQLSAAALRDLLAHHTDQLVDQVDAFMAGDYQGAYAVAREAFAHSVEIGDALALAIAGQFPDRYPDTNQPAPGNGAWVVAAALLLLLSAGLVSRRRRTTR